MIQDVNWMPEPQYISGYANGEPIFQVSNPWYLRIGDGINWSNWFQTSEIYSWENDDNGQWDTIHAKESILTRKLSPKLVEDILLERCKGNLETQECDSKEP